MKKKTTKKTTTCEKKFLKLWEKIDFKIQALGLHVENIVKCVKTHASIAALAQYH